MRRIFRLVLAASLLLNIAQARQPAPVDSAVAREAVQQVLAAWNTPTLGHWLASDFRGRDQLLAALSFDVPPMARLRILGIGNVQTLEQQRDDGVLRSLVSVTVRAQAEWEEPGQGLQRREGTSEYVLRIVRRVPR